LGDSDRRGEYGLQSLINVLKLDRLEHEEHQQFQDTQVTLRETEEHEQAPLSGAAGETDARPFLVRRRRSMKGSKSMGITWSIHVDA